MANTFFPFVAHIHVLWR